jgi:outer membrane protein assembly factor BamE (lipoprotein component of BamABCDE complex)/ketosteroid isomerase-like protein
MVSGCQLLPENAQLKSYRVLVQQGNVIDESKVDSLKVKMTREQVAFLLGEPVLNNIFNKDRWDYVYYRKRDPEETQLNMISIFFKENIVISMKRISKNNDGLFEVNEANNELPKLNNEIASLDNNIFDDVELQKEIKDKKQSKEINQSGEIENIEENEVKINNKKENLVGSNKDSTNSNKAESSSLSKKNIKDIEGNKKIPKESLKRLNDYDVVKSIINDWSTAWENKDVESYLSYYTSDYTSEYFDSHQLWKKDRENRIKNKSSIKILISNIDIEFNIEESEIAFVKFIQNYESDKYKDSVTKKITLIKENNNWKIKNEVVIDGNY